MSQPGTTASRLRGSRCSIKGQKLATIELHPCDGVKGLKGDIIYADDDGKFVDVKLYSQSSQELIGDVEGLPIEHLGMFLENHRDY